jgi:hypothetical protein
MRYVSLFLAPLVLALPQSSQNDGSTTTTAACAPWTGPSSLHPCQYDFYLTDDWLDNFIASLLEKEGVTRTQDLKNPWPSYLWEAYMPGSPAWSCDVDNLSQCYVPVPPTNSSQPQTQPYFVLQSIYTFSVYFHGLMAVLPASEGYFVDSPGSYPGIDQDLASIIGRFTPADNTRFPQNTTSRPCNYTTLYQLGLAVLSQFPLPPAITTDGWDWMNTNLISEANMPKSPQAACSSAAKIFQQMTSDYANVLRNVWTEFTTNSDMARSIIAHGGFITPPNNVILDWMNAGVNLLRLRRS